MNNSLAERAETMPSVSARMAWFQASARGNGIGLTVLRVHNSIQGIQQHLFIYVLPKFWSKALVAQDAPTCWILDEENLQGARITVGVFEQDTIGLPDSWAQGLRLASECNGREHNLAAIPEGPREGYARTPKEVVNSAADTLWVEVIAPSRRTVSQNMASQPMADQRRIQGFWQLIKHRASPLLLDPPPCASAMFHEPSARRWYIELFLTILGEVLTRRRPEFNLTSDALNAVRGRILTSKLVERKLRRTVPIWCEFDSLDANTQVWQAIRLAVLHCSGELTESAELIDLASEIDARLCDVSIESIHEVLRLQPALSRSIHDIELRGLYRIAISILRNEAMLAQSVDDSYDGLVFSFKVASSFIWEDLIAQAVEATPDLCADLHPKGRQMFKGGAAKNVDIAVRRDHGSSDIALILDAKYKSARSSIAQADMTDQYQIYVYANIWAVPAFLVYPYGEENIPPGLNVSAAIDNLGSHVGVIHLPFPQIGQTSIPISPSELSKVLNEAASGFSQANDGMSWPMP